MTVYSKKATIRFEDRNNMTKEIDLWLSTDHFKGIDYVTLKNKSFQNELDIEFMCSDVNPTNPKTQEDIDELLARLDVRAEPSEHVNDPLKFNNHLMEIITNLDNPNIDDTLRSKAKKVSTERLSKAQVKDINQDFEDHNKQLSETSTANSDRLKPLDARKSEFTIGEIERE